MKSIELSVFIWFWVPICETINEILPPVRFPSANPFLRVVIGSFAGLFIFKLVN